MTLALVAAFAPELAPYSPRADGTVDLGGGSAIARAVGVGLIAAAIGAAEIARARPSLVVFSGTCGAYEGALSLFDVIVARRVHLALPDVFAGRGRVPDGFAPPLDAPAEVVAALQAAGAISAEVATTPAITTDDALAARIAAETGCSGEHLEAYAVALACATYQVPFVAVLGVANRVGARAAEEWRAHHHEASARAAAVVRRAAAALVALRSDR